MLSRRLKDALGPSQRTEPILTTTGTRAAVESLAARTQALEEAVRQLAAAVEAMAESHRQDSV